MYSLVLMTAMASAPDAPEFNGYFRNLFSPNAGCNGCTGCTGCGGGGPRMFAPPGGCCGGGTAFLGIRDRFFGPGNGCCGGSGYASGCSGMSYSCYGSSPYGCLGGGVPIVPPPEFTQPFPAGPVPGMGPSIPYANPDPAPPTVIPDSRMYQPMTPNGFNTVSASPANDAARATVIVRLPADAKLYAEGSPLRMTGTERRFVSPPLPAGQEFTYRFKVEYDRDGETVSVTKKVPVRAGGTVAVEFSDLTAAKPDAKGGPANPPLVPVTGEPTNPAVPVSNPNPGAAPGVMPGQPAAADRAVITVKLPPGATLYVDDKKSNVTTPVRQFTTPPLPAGKEFAYVMKAEVVRDGRPEYVMQKVSFKAGDQLTVDFTDMKK
jgi:uncharacterized protein (TIGR03000 family)